MRRVLFAALLFLQACTTAPTPVSASLPEVTLPDLSRAEQSVQEQIAASYRTATSKPDDVPVSFVNLAV